MDGFHDREREIAALTARLERPASLSLVFGQRRVGKTFMLQRLLDGRPRALYFLADESTSDSLLRRFHAEVGAVGLGGPLWSQTRPADWGTALSVLFHAAQADGLILVLDELQYLVRSEPALPSILQRAWDALG